MSPAADVVSTQFRHLFPGRPLTDDEAATVEDVLDAAAAWAAGSLPLGEAAAIGAMAYQAPGGEPTFAPGRGRWVARWVTPKFDPRLPALIALTDALAMDPRTPVDAQGRVFTGAELDGVERRIAYEGGAATVRFPANAAVVKRRGPLPEQRPAWRGGRAPVDR